jgi:hypothetical protein
MTNINLGESTSAAKGSGQLTVASEGSVTVGATFLVSNVSNTRVNLIGGTLSVGTLNLSGNGSGLNWTSGTLLVNNQTMAVDGTLVVPADGTLGGKGLVNRATTVSPGGIVAPGASPGKLTFSNGLTLTSSGSEHSTLQVELGAPTTAGTTYDTLAITGGTFTIGGAELAVIPIDGAVANEAYHLATTDGDGVIDFSEMFSNLTLIGPGQAQYDDGRMRYLLSTSANGIDLTFQSVPEPTFLALTLPAAMLLMRRRRVCLPRPA